MKPETHNLSVSYHECQSMRALNRGEYSVYDIAELFDVDASKVVDHINCDCKHNQLDLRGHVRPKQSYSDEQLLLAFNQVYDRQPYQRMSQNVYRDTKPDGYPSVDTIIRRFGSWTKARELAHE